MNTTIQTPTRKLASIQRIADLQPIAGADAIERARVLSWALVVKKDEFEVGDLCVYCEIDSLMPKRPEFEFLRSSNHRIRTVKLRGQVSQGICFPLDVLGPDAPAIEEGADVTEHLGVEKYDPPIPTELAGEVKGPFPGFLTKTDETRIQAVANVEVGQQLLNGVLHRHRGRRFFATEKLDGTSVTIYLRDGDFGVCSRNLDLLESDTNTLWKVARKLDIEAKLRGAGRNLALQGELIGPNIQKNRYKLNEHDIAFFNVLDIDEHTFLDQAEFETALASFELASVPMVDEFALDHTVDELVSMSEAPSVLNPRQTREGLVIRAVEETRDEELGRLSFKVISPKFLLKGGD